MSRHWQHFKNMTMTTFDLQTEILICTGALTELYELGAIAYTSKNEEFQLILTERISTKKGEKAELERQLAEAKEKAAVAA